MRRRSGGSFEALNTQRIEAFSDGVFAIAITLLILELKAPHAEHEMGGLAHSLLSMWPQYFTYVLSFVTIGIYWANHHYVFHLYEKTNHIFNLLNVFFLMWISFLPFPTSVLGSHLLQAHHQRTATVFYAFGLWLPAASWLLMWLYASQGNRLIDLRLDPAYVRRLTWQYASSCFIYSIAIATALISYQVSLAICIGLTLLYLLPPRRPVYLPSQEPTS